MTRKIDFFGRRLQFQRTIPGFLENLGCTHEFFCLAETDTDRIPNRQEKFILQSPGLGRKKLVFGSKDTAKLVQEKLENAFPKLSHGGGFEILMVVGLKF